MQNVFPTLSRTPGSIRFAGHRIDQDREEILAELRASGRLPPAPAEAGKKRDSA
jgi:formyl-CoA transferase